MRSKLIKHVALMAATTIMTITPLVVTSCTFTKNDEAKLTSIQVTLPESMLWVEENEQAVSKPITVECFDQKQQPFEAETKLVLTTDEDLPVPSWIWIDKKNQINIKGDTSPSKYNFHIFAQDKDGKVKSDVKSLCVQVFESPLFVPDEIVIETKQENYEVCYTSPGDIELFAKGYKEEYPEELVSHACNWTITSVSGEQIQDLANQPIFRLFSTDDSCRVIVSPNIDASYADKTYDVTLQAVSRKNKDATDSITISVTIVNGFCFYDPVTKYTYTRNDLEQPWTLSLVDKETYALEGILEEKYGSKVTHIGANLCSNSGVRLTSVILPSSITYIGDNAFEKQTILSALAMPGVKYVGKSAFEGCGKVAFLRTYEQPKLEYVAQKAFYGCNQFQLDSVNCFNTIEDYAFCDSGLENIDLGGCITTIGNECFSNCENLKTITISAANPPSLSGNLFSGTTHLMAIFVPSSGIENYKTHKVWSLYQDIIVGI